MRIEDGSSEDQDGTCCVHRNDEIAKLGTDSFVGRNDNLALTCISSVGPCLTSNGVS